VLVYPQDLHEWLLLRHLEQAGVQVQRPVELVAFEHREDYVVAPASPATPTISCDPTATSPCAIRATDPMPWPITSATAPTGVSATDG